MGYTVWHFLRQANGRLLRVLSARWWRLWRSTERWPERAGQDLEMLEVTLEVDHRAVRHLLRVLPIRLRVADDGHLDQEQHSRPVRRLDGVFREDRPPSLAELVGQLEADANYFWEPMSPDLIIGAGRPSRSNACGSRACRLPTVTR